VTRPAMTGAGYLAVPVSDRRNRPDGWRVYPLPVGNGTRAVASFRGPFASFRAQRRARTLGRRSGS
jgi:hypothetical protein